MTPTTATNTGTSIHIESAKLHTQQQLLWKEYDINQRYHDQIVLLDSKIAQEQEQLTEQCLRTAMQLLQQRDSAKPIFALLSNAKQQQSMVCAIAICYCRC